MLLTARQPDGLVSKLGKVEYVVYCANSLS